MQNAVYCDMASKQLSCGTHIYAIQ